MPGAKFASTHWSLVLAAGGRSSAEGAAAFDILCHSYWRPLYSYVRRRGFSTEDAQDLTQSFFARLMETGSIGRAMPERGRFRTFLLTSMQNFLANEWDRDHTLKRGGGVAFLDLDEMGGAEAEYASDPVSAELPPDKLYERNWTLALLGRATARLEAEFDEAGKSKTFKALSGFLAGDTSATTYAEAAAALGIGEAAARVAVHRLRGRLRDLLRREISETIAEPDNPSAVAEELRYMLGTL
jgi:RNA polymerase sigma-70 factor (ECF subfamily)